MSFAEIYTANLRGWILLLLTRAECEVSLAMLRSSIETAARPHKPSMNKLRAEVDWLAQRGLVQQRKIDGAIEGVIITERGDDVANGRERVAGVDIDD